MREQYGDQPSIADQYFSSAEIALAIQRALETPIETVFAHLRSEVLKSDASPKGGRRSPSSSSSHSVRWQLNATEGDELKKNQQDVDTEGYSSTSQFDPEKYRNYLDEKRL